MTHDLSSQQIDELLPAYVLGALEPEEMLAMDDYIQRQRVLLAQLESLELTVVQLTHAAPAARLPEANKAQLMARVEADLAPTAPAAAPVARPRLREESRPSLRRRLETWFQPPIVAGLSVAALVLAMLYGAGIQGQFQQLSQQRAALAAEVATLRSETTELQQTNQRLEQQLQGQQAQMAFLASAPRAVVAPGTEAAPQASAVFYEQGAEGLFVWTGLEALPEGQVYQLWLIPADGNPAPAGLLSAVALSSSTLKVEVPAELQDYAAVGVTIEPSGGSDSPTGPLVLLGEVG